MSELILDCALDALKDGALSIPILFLAYLLMEMLENSKRLDEGILHSYSRKAGPALGGLLGAIPQCGISGAAATLFSTGSISAGTMLAVFFATSDEMLPVMLSSLADGKGATDIGQVAAIVAAKAVMGIVLGYLVDAFGSRLFARDKNLLVAFAVLTLAEAVDVFIFARDKNIHSFCEREHCECDEEEGSVWLSALKHTVKIAVMLIAVTFALNIILELVGIERLGATVFAAPVVGELLLALFGLIPNCSVSVVITEAYLSGIIGLGGLFAGLLSNAGIGLLVLLRTNKNRRENLTVIALLFILGAVSGMLINLVV